jgi:hypothetical protein
MHVQICRFDNNERSAGTFGAVNKVHKTDIKSWPAGTFDTRRKKLKIM